MLFGAGVGCGQLPVVSEIEVLHVFLGEGWGCGHLMVVSEIAVRRQVAMFI